MIRSWIIDHWNWRTIIIINWYAMLV